jgi:TatD DNase family protein
MSLENGALLTDTHTHLCDPSFDRDRAEVLERARRAGVAKVISVAENISDAEKNLVLASRHPMIRPAAGLYPTALDMDEAREMRRFLSDHSGDLVAIGEVGLDHWKVKTEAERAVQLEIFKGFVILAKDLGLPLNIHSRSAGKHAIDLLLRLNAEKVHLHAFDGKAATALPAAEAGFFFSIPPSIARSNQKRKLVKRLPLSCLLVETDSPVLGPNPQERNEPANVRISIEAIAEIKNVGVDEVIGKVVENTHRLYGEL